MSAPCKYGLTRRRFGALALAAAAWPLHAQDAEAIARAQDLRFALDQLLGPGSEFAPRIDSYRCAIKRIENTVHPELVEGLPSTSSG